MKLLWKDLLISACLGLVIPLFLLQLAVAGRKENLPQPEPMSQPPARIALTVSLRQGEGEPAEMDMDEYLVGVLLAEMPVYFEEEALKAQAVVARTYARKAWETGGKHGDGSVCDQPSCCQGYRAVDAYLASGGEADSVDKLRAAAAATSGQVLCYEGSLIEATYFSCSGGKTEDAVAVWGQDFPYLRSVDSPGEEEASHYRDDHVFAPAQFAAALGIDPSGEPQNWLGTATYTGGGGVNTMVIGGKTFTGVELRTLLGLRSTALTIEAEKDRITVTTRGYGHRVGMSQYGADAMASGGSGYEQILAHYYPGTELVCLPAEPESH